MSRPVFSASWYRVAQLTPRLRSNARIHRHQYRGDTWYILEDIASERMHRFSPAAYLIIGLMDGRHTVQELWDVATGRLGDDAPTQDEMIQLLSQLQTADVLQCDVPPDTAELLRRYDERQRKVWWSRWLSPLSWRVPLIDPERFLAALLPLARPFFSVAGALAWVAIVGTALVLTAVHWQDLTRDVVDRMLIPRNVLLLWLCFPVVKIVHEFGHAFAVKRFGGEVHEMGVMLLVFTPIPYVDASASTAFRSKWHRMLVGLAGMGVELAVASGALFVWLAAEPGVLRTLAYNVILIAGLSTVLFNANPLLRYDGYYVLADALEIPNLYTRSRAWLAHVVERHVFGRRDAEPPPATPGERAWFAVYATASFAYRVLVVVAIVMFLMQRSFYVGALIALLGLCTWGVMPVWKGASYLFTSPRLREVRARAVAVTVAGVAVIVAVLLAVPAPFRTRAEGVVWIPDEASVRPESEGFVEAVVATPGRRVKRGDLLVVMYDRELVARATGLAARVRELTARIDSQRATDRVKVQIVEEELRYAQQELQRVRQRLEHLAVRARTDGSFVLFRAGAPCACQAEQELKGRFVKQGELLGYVLDVGRLTVRVAVQQAHADLVRHHTDGIQVRLSERLTEPLAAVVRREVPGATDTLPSAALGTEGGGAVAIDPRDPKGSTAMSKVFQVDLDVPSGSALVNVGGRVYVRFDHPWEPLVQQWWREVRQLFLARFNV